MRVPQQRARAFTRPSLSPARRGALLKGLAFFLVWVAFAVPAWLVLFLNSETHLVVASHDATVSPTLDRYSRIEMGPYLPDFRVRSDDVVGVDIEFGKTAATSAGQLVQRYALLASRPEPEIRRIADEIRGLAVSAALRAALVALVPIALWLLLGPQRRAELLRPSVRRASVAVGVAIVVLVASFQPWRDDNDAVRESTWTPVRQAVPELQVPEELSRFEVQGGLLTQNTRKFISSSFDSYERSTAFFEGIADRAPTIAAQLRQPEDDEVTAVLVSDRHDNISMDAVVRRVADLVGATAIIDAGDDTSTGEPWEAFSLDSLDEAFGDFDGRVFVTGNHDHGGFVARHLTKLGWTHLDAEPVEAFGGVRFFGVDDPRSSGLGSWRDEKGLSFDEVRQRLADEVCRLDEADQRVATVVVHDANLARETLARGCTDLVLAGHLHRQVGPDRVVGANGKVGYTYTNGTTGGAAYAIAIASKLRREAEFTFVTYRDQRVAGVQPVRITPAGEYIVEEYVELDLGSDEESDTEPGSGLDPGLDLGIE